MNYIPNFVIWVVFNVYSVGDIRFSNKMTKLDPPKYNANKAPVKKSCVIGSVDGVTTAATIVDRTITYFQADNIFWPVTIPDIPNNTWTIGTWNTSPVVKIKTAKKSKYWSKDQKGSTTSEP